MRILETLGATALAIALVGALAGVASAANHATPATKEAKPAAEKTRRHVGTVKAVDAGGKTLTVAEKSGEATLTVTDKTTIKRGKDTVKLEDLKTGNTVTVVYTQQNGKDVARSIVVEAQ